MRYYEITAGPLSYTSLNPDGSTNPAALNVELDIAIDAGDVTHNGSSVRIWGIGMQDISQSRNLFNQPFSMKGGMAAGLPLANPAQAGYLSTGKIWQGFGNWIGTDQTLDLIITPSGSAPANGGANPVQPPTPLVLNWKKGQALSTALQQTLMQTFPGMKVNMQIGSYIAPEDQPHYAQNLKNFGYFLRRMTQNLGGAGAPGISISVEGGAINVTDGSQQQTAGVIAYQDLIGQPTWIGPNKIQIKTVMRGDMHINRTIQLPQTAVTNTPGNGVSSGGSFRNSLTFQGACSITAIRHCGNFRQPDPASWVTILEATTGGS